MCVTILETSNLCRWPKGWSGTCVGWVLLHPLDKHQVFGNLSRPPLPPLDWVFHQGPRHLTLNVWEDIDLRPGAPATPSVGMIGWDGGAEGGGAEQVGTAE